MSERLWGSTTEELVARSPLPIIVGPYERDNLGAADEPAGVVQLAAPVDVRR